MFLSGRVKFISQKNEFNILNEENCINMYKVAR